jgi:hypothetical protein
MREAGKTRHNLIYQINVYDKFEVLCTITANNVHITALARRLVKEAAAFVEGKLKGKQVSLCNAEWREFVSNSEVGKTSQNGIKKIQPWGARNHPYKPSKKR